MNRIGILGGTFNPIHVGHLVAAQVAQEEMRLDQVIFVPSFLPPHKTEKNLASAADRLAMVRLAIRDNPKFTVSDFEIKKGGKSYSIDTVRFFRKKFPQSSTLFFIIGADELNALKGWKDINELVNLVSFIAVNRPGYKPAGRKLIKHESVEMPAIDLSSSLIRNRAAAGKSTRFLVPDRVALYIEKAGLYQTTVFITNTFRQRGEQ